MNRALLVGLTLVASTILPRHTYAEGQLGIGNCQVIDLVGDSLVKPGGLDKRYLSLLEKPMYLRYEGTKEKFNEFNANGYYWLKNCLVKPTKIGGPVDWVDFKLEIEIVSYGYNRESLKEALLMTWVWGPLITSLTSKDQELIVGFVQYRITANLRGKPGELVVVGRGGVAGEVDELSRKEALEVAAQRALENAAFELVSELSRRLGFKDYKGFENAGWEDYLEQVEKYSEENGE